MDPFFEKFGSADITFSQEKMYEHLAILSSWVEQRGLLYENEFKQ